MLEALCASRRMPKLIFLHVPKTGGTTLRKILEREYEPEEIFEFYNFGVETRIAHYGRLLEPARAAVRVLSGHLFYGVHEQVGEPPLYVTMLRDPVRRVMSLYRHRSTLPTQGFERVHAEEMGLEEFIHELRPVAADNGQVRMLSGVRGLPFGECTPELLEQAKRNIREHFALVLLTERFDESVLLLRRMFGWKTPCYVRENVSTKRLRPEDRSASAIELIERHNRLDAELYRFAAALFHELVELQGESLRKELQEFQLLNQSAGQWMSPEVVWSNQEAAAKR